MLLKSLFDFAGYMERNAQQVSELVRRFPREAILVRPDGDEFCVIEHVCHLRDLERDGFTPRISAVLNEHDPQLYDFDGAAVARASDYPAENCEDALAAFLEARSRNVAKLRDAPAEAIDRVGHYEPGSPVTLTHILNGVLSHDDDHLQRLQTAYANAHSR